MHPHAGDEAPALVPVHHLVPHQGAHLLQPACTHVHERSLSGYVRPLELISSSIQPTPQSCRIWNY
jgi:hypothetical protein